MNKYKQLITLSLCLLGSFVLVAQVPKDYRSLIDTSSFKSKMIEMSTSILTLESSFEQERYISVLSEKIKSSGTFLFKKENKLRWEYTVPYKYLIVLDGSKMYIKDKGNVKKFNLSANEMFKSINEMLLSMVKGNLFDNNEYSVEYHENSMNYLLVLHPLNTETKKYLETIQLTISKNDFAVTKVKMIEIGGDYTRIKFANRKLNAAVSDDQFKVK